MGYDDQIVKRFKVGLKEYDQLVDDASKSRLDSSLKNAKAQAWLTDSALYPNDYL